MKPQLLFQPTILGDIAINNRIIMAPMTRARAGIDDCPSNLHCEYYRQRATAGLIISEGVHPSAQGKGYWGSPGLYLQSHIDSWRNITTAVHQQGGKMVMQLMHCGRVAHPDNRNANAGPIIAPAAIAADTKIYTPNGLQTCPTPQPMTINTIKQAIADYQLAAEYALQAGFDGIELHCTSGYLPAQFLATGSNTRQDEYGGSVSNRLRFVIELLQVLIKTAGAGRVGIRICPGNPFNDLQDTAAVETFTRLLQTISTWGLAYLHIIRLHGSAIDNLQLAKKNYNGNIIVNDSYTKASAEQAIANGFSAVSFARAFIANPDLVYRFKYNMPLADFDPRFLYQGAARGYIDYPSFDNTN